VQPLFFFLITVSLFPFSLGNDPDLLKLIMPSVSWVAIVLAIMMSLSSLFRGDFEDGSLEQWLPKYWSIGYLMAFFLAS